MSALAIGVGASIVGEASAAVVLSNFPGSGPDLPGSTGGHAVQFTTGAGSWSLQSGSFYGMFSTSVTLEIWTVSGNTNPNAGTLLGSASTSDGAGLSVGGSQNHEVTFSSDVALAASTTYWAVFTSIDFRAPTTTTLATAQNSSGWSGESTSLAYVFNGSSQQFEWNSANNIFYQLNATSASAVPGAGIAGLATLGLAGVSRRRRRCLGRAQRARSARQS
ncbi:MAG: hypothetical protein ACO38V_09680, partial [Phycisphaerales bacterium]